MRTLIDELDRCAEAGQQITFWLRDDDAVAVTPALERLLDLVGQWNVPTILAVVPMPAEAELAVRLAGLAAVKVASHGFAHRNHAPPGEKKQELGSHRPAAVVLDEIRRGHEKLAMLFPGQAVPMLVPPWNRIAPELLPRLPGLHLRYVSTIGEQPPHEPIAHLVKVDCQLDIIDWRARRCHSQELLADRLSALVRRRSEAPGPIGILSHHLVHDEAAWLFLAGLFRLTARHEAAAWSWPVTEFSA